MSFSWSLFLYSCVCVCACVCVCVRVRVCLSLGGASYVVVEYVASSTYSVGLLIIVVFFFFFLRGIYTMTNFLCLYAGTRSL